MEMLTRFYGKTGMDQLNARYDVTIFYRLLYEYIGRIKAMPGAQGGTVCASSNVKKIFDDIKTE